MDSKILLSGYKNLDDRENAYDMCMVFKKGLRNKHIIVGASIGYHNPIQVAFSKFKNRKDERKVIMFDHFEEQRLNYAQFFEDAGLKFKMFKSKDKMHIICYVTADEKRLREEAHRISYELEFNPRTAFEQGKRLNLALAKWTDASDHPEINLDNWRYLYGTYMPNDPKYINRLDLYKSYEGNSIFRPADRIKLLYIILEAKKEVRGCGLSLGGKVKDKTDPLDGYNPLHEYKKLRNISRKFAGCHIWDLPLLDVRNYWGEHTAFFCGFLQVYLKALLIPALIGSAVFIWNNTIGKNSVFGIMVFGIMMSVWSSLLMEVWKRDEARLRGKWGMSNFTKNEQPRPGFKATSRPSPISGQDEEYTETRDRVEKTCYSSSTVMVLITTVVIFYISIILFNNWLILARGYSSDEASYIASSVYGFGIQLTNKWYGIIAKEINKYENWKTDTEYENALIAKTFIFKFVNSYISLFYIAFVQRYNIEYPCPTNDPTCVNLLRQTLQSLFIAQFTVSNFVNLIIPYVKVKLVECSPLDLSEVTDGEKDYHRKTAYTGTMYDFDDLVLYHGYASLFVVVFPITPLFALIGQIINSKIFTWLLVHQYQRPEPKGAASIGAWYTVIEIIGYFNIITNVALVTVSGDVSMTFMPNASMAQKLLLFIVCEHVLVFVKVLINALIPDEPVEEVVRYQREQYIVKLLLNNIPVVDCNNGETKETDQDKADREEQLKQKYSWEALGDSYYDNASIESDMREIVDGQY